MDVDQRDSSVDELSREMSKSLSVHGGVAASMEGLEDSTADPKIKQSLLDLDSAKGLLKNLDSMTRSALLLHHSQLMKTSYPERKEEERLKSSLRGAVTEWMIRELSYGERRRILTAQGVTPYANHSKLLGQLKQEALGQSGYQVVAAIVEILASHHAEADVDLGSPSQ